eukprot:5294310-Amphidinium_carterae.2
MATATSTGSTPLGAFSQERPLRRPASCQGRNQSLFPSYDPPQPITPCKIPNNNKINKNWEKWAKCALFR